MCRMKKSPNELYSEIPVGWGSRAYYDISSRTICHWVYIAGRFTVCEFSRQVYSEFVKYVHILCIRVHSVGQFVYHELSSGMYLVFGVFICFGVLFFLSLGYFYLHFNSKFIFSFPFIFPFFILSFYCFFISQSFQL